MTSRAPGGSGADPLHVTVVMATYNGSRFVEEQVRSVLGQTHPVDLLLVRDDASTDGTVSIVRAALATSSVPALVRVNPVRVGAVRNFALLLEEAVDGAGIVLLCDQDDVWRPDKVSQVVHAARASPAASMIISNGNLIGADGGPVDGDLLTRTGFDRRARQALLQGQLLRILTRRAVVPGAVMAVRAEALADGLPLSAHGWHDQWLLLVAAARGGVVLIDEPLIDYRLHDANAVGLVEAGRAGFTRHRLRQAPGSRGDALAQEVQLFGDLARWAQRRRRGDVEAVALLAAAHAQRRLELPSGRTRRAARVAAAVCRGGYPRDRAGVVSALADVVRPAPLSGGSRKGL